MFWKRSSSADPHASHRAEYRKLQEEARRATHPDDRARLLNQAGDVALSIGDEDGAMKVLGDALDLYIRERQYHPARAIARKLLRIRATTVRVRSTLAWLAIAHDLPADARVALDLYVSSLRADGQREFAVRHLAAMAHATNDRDLRTVIAQHLDDLGASDAAAEIRARLEAEASGAAQPPSAHEVRARSEEALDRLVSPGSR